jgi:hypothetical protein
VGVRNSDHAVGLQVSQNAASVRLLRLSAVELVSALEPKTFD